MKIRTSIAAKVLAWILIAVSGLGLVGSGLLAVSMERSGFYSRKYSDIRKERFATFNDRYSARVLDYLYAKEDSNQEYFADKNFKYGVIEADFLSDIEKLDLNDKKNYIDTNFDFVWKLELENLHVFQCTINENTYFSYKNPDSLWGHYWISNTSDGWWTYSISDFVYDVESGIIFAECAGQYYPVPNVVLHINDGSFLVQGFAFDRQKCAYIPYDVTGELPFGEKQYDASLTIEIETVADEKTIKDTLAELYAEGKDNGVTLMELEGTVLGTQNWAEIEFSTRQENYENTALTEIVEITATDTTVTEIPDRGDVYDSGNSYSWSQMTVGLSYVGLDSAVSFKNLDKEVRMHITEYDDMFVYVKPTNLKSNTYFVLSYQEADFSYDRDLTLAGETDVFGQFDLVIGTLYGMRYQVFEIFFGCLAVFAAAFIFLCCAAGHKKGQTGLMEAWINRVPLELYAAVVTGIVAGCVVIAGEASWELDGFGDVFWITLLIAAVLAAGLSVTAAAIEIVSRIKLRVLWKNTICGWIISKLFGGMKQVAAFAAKHTGLVWKAALAVGVNAVLDFFIFLFMMHEGAFGLFLFVIKAVILLLLALSAVSQLKKLKEAGEHMAKGNLTHRVDTNGLFWDFKQHGENLNSVSEGLSIAVEERMKSERFKTELITNVSHDIKTPLTSIINYVDLIQKEEVNNQKIEEYLEVLERQSKRLKKLLEDLLEASKASAGTLPVGLETLEAGVFMVQTVGEFEEKTAAQNLELIIKKPDEPVYINADGRHFWRVIDNLMNNICKYAQPHTRVYINLDATEEEVYITFRNTSRYPLNITSEELMERFVRGDESRHTEGSGLGLSIAQSLMELMHGQFELFVDGDLFKVVLMFRRVSNGTH